MACWPKIVHGATGCGGIEGDDNDVGSPIGNYAQRSISGKGHDQEHWKQKIEGGEHTIGRLVETDISAANAQDGQSPPPNPTLV
jgi:hypothetical protein